VDSARLIFFLKSGRTSFSYLVKEICGAMAFLLSGLESRDDYKIAFIQIHVIGNVY
jgi:hypothetical protein